MVEGKQHHSLYTTERESGVDGWVGWSKFQEQSWGMLVVVGNRVYCILVQKEAVDAGGAYHQCEALATDIFDRVGSMYDDPASMERFICYLKANRCQKELFVNRDWPLALRQQVTKHCFVRATER